MSLTKTVEFVTANLGHNQTEAVQFANKIQERKMEALYSMTEEETIEYTKTTLVFTAEEAELYAGQLEERKQEIQKVQDQANLLEQKDADALLERHGITAKDLFGKGATANRQRLNRVRMHQQGIVLSDVMDASGRDKPDQSTVATNESQKEEVVDLSANSPDKRRKRAPLEHSELTIATPS